MNGKKKKIPYATGKIGAERETEANGSESS